MSSITSTITVIIDAKLGIHEWRIIKSSLNDDMSATQTTSILIR